MTTLDPAIPPGTPSSPKTPAGAVWSLVLGILSMFCLWILGSIPAIILGALALRKINANPGQWGGKGIALAGIITGSVGILTGLVTVAIAASVAMPAYNQINDRAETAMTASNLRQVALTCRLYAIENENKFPETLEQLVPEYLDEATILFSEDPESGEKIPFLYRSGLNVDSPPNEPLAISPKIESSGTRIIAYASGAVDTLREPIDPEILKHFE